MSILPWTWILVILPNRIEGNTMAVNREHTVPKYRQDILEEMKHNKSSKELSLEGRQDAQLLMQKLSTIPANNDRIEFDSRSKKPRKSHSLRNRSHHHHGKNDLDLYKKINIRKDVSTSPNSSVLRDLLMQKIKVFSRVKLGKRKPFEPGESWEEFYDSSTLASREVNEHYILQDSTENLPSVSEFIRQPLVAASDFATKLTGGEQYPSKAIHQAQVWHQHKRSSKQDQFLRVEETTTVKQRRNGEQRLGGKISLKGNHNSNFRPGGIVPEQFNDENQKTYFPLNIKETIEESIDIQADDSSINKLTVNATKDLNVGNSNLNTEYLEEYDDLAGPYISEELVSQTKALNRNLVSKTVSIDNSLNEQSENISKTELLDSGAGPTNVSISSIVGLGLGSVMFLLILSVLSATLLYKRQYLRKAESMDKSFVSCDSYSGSYADSETFNSISYADCAGIEIAKDNSSEELYNLDNDSFLNSLEAISFPEYWTDKL